MCWSSRLSLQTGPTSSQSPARQALCHGRGGVAAHDRVVMHEQGWMQAGHAKQLPSARTIASGMGLGRRES